ncbi:MAG: hypothetical protein F6K16_04795 [Symploca sp. SIO2B6]|nr:hypothetical protein [Symploca sp. SIO2B6]
MDNLETIDYVDQSKQLIIADAHVHIYDCFDLDKFLNAAANNFNNSALNKGYKDRFESILFLTETKFDNKFLELLECANNYKKNNSKNQWIIDKTKENYSLYASNSNNQKIFIIAGRQIVTAENLEVLALITAKTFEDGLPIKRVIQDVINSGGIPVIPWGFGKWIRSRGKILTNLLQEENLPILFLGDNSGRPHFWSTPPYFKQAEQRGLRILPGTDPLPFNSEFWRPGSFGFTLEGSLNPDEPANSIKKMLLDPTTKLQSYGSLETPFRFVRNQLAMQILKRQRRKI